MALLHTNRTVLQTWLPVPIRVNDIQYALASLGIALCFVAVNACAGDPPVAGTRHIVEISGFAFVPAQLQVATGDSVTWVNRDVVPHTIQVAGGAGPLSPELLTGDEFTLTVHDPMHYVCGLHLSMQGQLAVDTN